MTKKTENVEQIVTTNPTLQSIASKLGVKNVEGGDEVVISAIAKRMELIEEKFAPVATLIGSDPRAYRLMELAMRGATVEEMIADVSNLANIEDNPKYVNTVGEATNFCCKHNLDTEGIEAFVSFIEEAIKAVSHGSVTVDILELFWKSYNHTTEIKEAFDAGVVAGKNSRIEAERDERNSAENLGNIAVGRNIETNSQRQGYIEKLLSSKR